MIPVNTTFIVESLSNPIVIPICALGVSIASILIGYFGMKYQREHNKLSVRPICGVGWWQNPFALDIWIINNGVGPMIIKSIETTDKLGNKKENLADWIPKADRQKYWENLGNTALLNGNKINILGFIFASVTGDGQQVAYPLTGDQIKKREEIRGILKDLTIHIRFKDIYGIEQPKFSQSFDILGQEILDNLWILDNQKRQ